MLQFIAKTLQEGRAMAHANKHIREALKHAAKNGWNIVEGGGHAWGKIYCQHGHVDCWMMIWSTPRNPENHAKRICKLVGACPGLGDAKGD